MNNKPTLRLLRRAAVLGSGAAAGTVALLAALFSGASHAQADTNKSASNTSGAVVSPTLTAATTAFSTPPAASPASAVAWAPMAFTPVGGSNGS